MALKNSDLFEIWISTEKLKRQAEVSKKILSSLSLSDDSEGIEEECDKVSHFFCLAIDKK